MQYWFIVHDRESYNERNDLIGFGSKKDNPGVPHLKAVQRMRSGDKIVYYMKSPDSAVLGTFRIIEGPGRYYNDWSDGSFQFRIKPLITAEKSPVPIRKLVSKIDFLKGLNEKAWPAKLKTAIQKISKNDYDIIEDLIWQNSMKSKKVVGEEWIKIYKEIARRVKEYRENQTELIYILSEISSRKLPNINLKDRMEDSIEIDLEVIDPFTFFASFNRNIKEENKKRILELILDKLNLNLLIPSNFAGIPTVNLQNSWFFPFKYERKKDDIDLLWELFELAIEGKNSVSAELFRKVLNIKQVGLTKITIGLFWVNPEEFLPLDQKTLNLIKKELNLEISNNNISYEEYLNFVELIQSIFSDCSFTEITRLADEPISLSLLQACVVILNDDNRLHISEMARKIEKRNLWYKVHGEKIPKLTLKNILLRHSIKKKEKGFSHEPLIFDYEENNTDENDVTFFLIPSWRKVLREYSIEEYNQITQHLPVCDIESKKHLDSNSSVKGLETVRFSPKKILMKEFINKKQLEEVKRLLLTHKQLILYGPPGTGKTYLAQVLAQEVAGEKYEIIQFHPSYSYEDFIEGIDTVPSSDNKSVMFLPKARIFRQLCEKAISLKDQLVVLIIDEINRGDLSRIFGEIIIGLEVSYRDNIEITTPLSGALGKLKIPSNLFIIGTMNSLDRSISIVDYAIRRRFSFYLMMPDFKVLKKWLDTNIDESEDGEKVLNLFLNLNSKIKKDEQRLGEHYQIGHSYFFVKNEEEMKNRWKYMIKPLLEEYLNHKKEYLDDYRYETLIKDLKE